MKKVAVLLVLLLAGILFLSSCKKEAEDSPAPAELEPTSYTITASLSPADGKLSVRTEIAYSLPADDLTEIPLRVYAAIYREGNLPVREARFAEVYPNGRPSYGSVDILSITTAANDPIDYEEDETGTLLTLRPSKRGKKGERVTLVIEEEILLSNAKHLLGRYDGYWNLSRFYPEVCPYRGGGYLRHPITPYGDPFVTETSDFSVTLTLPANYVVAASAVEDRRETQGTSQAHHYTLKGARDFAAVASPLLRKRSGKAAGIPIVYCFTNDRQSAETLAHIEKCLAFFSETFGDYPYPSYTVVSAPFFEAGMEHSGLSLLSDGLSASERQETVTHETAHQWWFGKVGNDEFADPWMDEGLAEYATAYFYKAQGSNVAYRAAVKRAESAYATRLAIKGQAGTRADLPLPELEEGYSDRVYAGGLLLFHLLAQSVGHERLNAALHRYADDYAGQIATPSDLISSLSSSLEHDYAPFFRLFLSASLPAL